MSATHYGPCPTCGQGTFNAPYSCEGCIEAIPDPFAGRDLEAEYDEAVEKCCHGFDDLCVAAGCMMGIPGGEHVSG